jgi:hypothetical protein
MRLFRPAVFAAAAIATASFAGMATAATNAAHVLLVRLPGGQIEQIRYTGDTAPQVRIASGGAPLVLFARGPDQFAPSPAFLRMQAISAAMTRRAALMLQQAALLQANGGVGPGGLTLARVSNLPAGAHGAYMVWTSNGNGGCARSVQYASSGPGRTPTVISKSAGDCGPAAAPSPTRYRGPAPASGAPQPVAYHN